jgi:dipeptidase E
MSLKKTLLKMIDGEVSRLEATILTTASKQKENNRFAIKAKNDLIQMGLKTVDFTDIEYERPEKLEHIPSSISAGATRFICCTI